MTEIATASLSAEDARLLTDEVKADAQSLWRRMLGLYDRGAHVALGYASWSEYCGAEFDMAHAMAHRLLGAGRVVETLSIQMDSEPVITESQARELSPLRAEPDLMVGAWTAAKEWADDEERPVTAQDVRATVRVVREEAAAEVIEKPKDLLGPYIAKRAREEKALGIGEFSWVSAAASDLRKLPPLERLWLPNDKGNVDALDDDVRFLIERIPKIAALWERHLSNLNRTEAA